ncbi:MAG TPA: hypothetical protein VGN63_01770 [Flavisolibacter sp.]|nr:hypothetical protein [Flavisolibacter sp.]
MLVSAINPFHTDLKSSPLLHTEFSILFICGSLEKGKDGVGDYVIKLAIELVQRGYKPAILALNDSYIKEPIKILHPEDERGQLKILRLPVGMSSARKKRLCADFVTQFDPTVISLQFVPYSFNAKGIPYGLSKALMNLNNEKIRWHIMFHEIWLAETKGWKQKIIGLAQRRIIKDLVKVLDPIHIHCSIEATREKLSKLQIKSTILPLFGNIGFHRFIDVSLKNQIDSYKYRILYFGAAPRDEFLKSIVSKLGPISAKWGKSLCIVVVGKNSTAKSKFIEILRAKLSVATGIIDAGFLEEKSISYLMQFCTIGIARSTPELLGKSGTAIAMLEFGLPIWLPRATDSDTIEFPFRRELIFSNPEKAFDQRKKDYQSLLPTIATQFINSLQHQIC